MEGWRRLECEGAPGASLSGLPLGLGVLSLQVKRWAKMVLWLSSSCILQREQSLPTMIEDGGVGVWQSPAEGGVSLRHAGKMTFQRPTGYHLRYRGPSLSTVTELCDKIGDSPADFSRCNDALRGGIRTHGSNSNNRCHL